MMTLITFVSSESLSSMGSSLELSIVGFERFIVGPPRRAAPFEIYADFYVNFVDVFACTLVPNGLLVDVQLRNPTRLPTTRLIKNARI